MKIYKYLSVALLFLSLSCNKNKTEADAYGNFEAQESIISAETAGRIIALNIDDGQECDQGFLALVIDTLQYNLKKKELVAKKLAAIAKKENIKAQAEVYIQQKKVLLTDLDRVKKMQADGAATSKQLDDLEGQVQVIDKQIVAVKSNLLGIDAEVAAINAGIDQIVDMITRSAVKTPFNGVILAHYAELGEVTAPGKALFKLANIKELDLKAFISGEQLSTIKLGQKVRVSIDGTNGDMIDYEGTLSWIAPDAEFTPKNIQTKEERLSQVYAIKVKVVNDGAIKINMPGEVRF
jgi:HlyD family secretion protein